MIRKLLVVSGNIQEGGIRYFAQINAAQLKLTGFTKRGAAGTIEIEVQGNESNIEKFVDKLKVGNGFFTVEDITVRDIEIVANEKMFSIK